MLKGQTGTSSIKKKASREGELWPGAGNASGFLTCLSH